MIDGADLISLETRVRRHINEPSAALWTQADVFAAINDERVRLCRKIIGLNCGYMEQVYSPSPAATITLPTNCYLIRNVELYQDSAWRQPSWIRDAARGQYQSAGTTYPGAVQFVNNTLVFENGIGSASQVRIKYARIPSSMIYCTLAGGSATTAVMPSSASPSVLDDAYNDDLFVVLSGTGAGQVSTVTDYVASTRTLTVAAGATLDSSTVISFLLPEPLSSWKDLVARGAAIDLLSRNRDDNRAAMIANEYERDMRDMVDTLSQRQTVQAEHGNYHSWGDD